jgi:aryl-alcohol dehydrogenase-like predicted oxidoreductase
LGTSDLDITRLGVGAWAMGGSGWAFGWGQQDDKDSIAAIRAAIDAGINWIDTAAVYGLGHSEEVVAKALEGVTNRPYIFTKCERRWDENGKIFPSLKAESIRKECEDSLRRLKVDTIDLYQVHWPDPDREIEEGWTEMARLKEEGKVRWIGVSNFNVEHMQRAQKIAPITSLQPPYSLLVREVEKEVLPFAQRNNIGVIVYSPMRNGLLSGGMTKERALNFPEDDWRRRNPDFQEPKLTSTGTGTCGTAVGSGGTPRAAPGTSSATRTWRPSCPTTAPSPATSPGTPPTRRRTSSGPGTSWPWTRPATTSSGASSARPSRRGRSRASRPASTT